MLARIGQLKKLASGAPFLNQHERRLPAAWSGALHDGYGAAPGDWPSTSDGRYAAQSGHTPWDDPSNGLAAPERSHAATTGR